VSDTTELIVDVASATAQTFAGRIDASNTGGLTKRGEGTLTLEGRNDFTGPLTVSAGTLSLGAGGAINTPEMILEGGATFDFTSALAPNAAPPDAVSNATFVSSTNQAMTLRSLTINPRMITANGEDVDPLAVNPLASNASVPGETGLTLLGARIVTNGAGLRIEGTDKEHPASIVYTMPADIQNNATLLTVDGKVVVKNTAITLTFPDSVLPDGRPVLPAGLNRFVLIDVKPDPDLTAAAKASAKAGDEEKMGDYEFATLTVVSNTGDIFTLTVDVADPNDLIAVLTNANPNGPTYERIKAYAESRIAMLALVDQGQDLIAIRGLDSMMKATQGRGFRIGAFGAVDGGRSQYDTGTESHVNLASQLSMTGIGMGGDSPLGRLSLASFVETGFGNYRTYDGFTDAKAVHGDGITSYIGTGLLARLNSRLGLYLEASGRLGQARLEYSTDEILYGADAVKAAFETYTTYYGAHAGAGVAFAIPNTNKKVTMDLSARMFWTHLDPSGATTSSDRLHFEGADSLRLRMGGRLTFAMGQHVSAFAGAYWEHEYDGRQRTLVNGRVIATPSLKGDTGIGELGVTFRPTKDIPLFIDVGVQGFVGRRTGAAGSVQVRIEY
jgi:autotransporter-associated beta strand protein